MMKRFGVVGNPVTHSLSPKIHHAFAKQSGIALKYEKYCVDTESDIFEIFARDFFYQGGSGLNITLPFKQRTFQLVDELTERARLAGAVNTLIPLSPTRILGDNTDGVGLIRDLKEQYQQSLVGKSILILGSGGATKGILPALLAENLQQIMIARRGALPWLPDQWAGTKACSYEDLTTPFDLIINATPLSLSNELPSITSVILHAKSFCYDLAYSAQRETIFTRWAQEQGVKAADGLGMLMYQAAEAFYQWHDVYPRCNAALFKHCVNNT